MFVGNQTIKERSRFQGKNLVSALEEETSTEDSVSNLSSVHGLYESDYSCGDINLVATIDDGID